MSGRSLPNTFQDKHAGQGNVVDDANNYATVGGGIDAALKVPKAAGGMGQTAGAASKALGPIGGMLSAFGLGWDIADIATNGLGVGNGLSATTNALGAGSFVAGAAGSTVAAPVMAAGAAGLTLGNRGNSFMSELGWLGNNSDGSGRSWSDWSGDTGYDAYEWAKEKGAPDWLAHTAGIGTTLATSIAAVPGAAIGGAAGLIKDGAGLVADGASWAGGKIADGASAAWSAVTSW